MYQCNIMQKEIDLNKLSGDTNYSTKDALRSVRLEMKEHSDEKMNIVDYFSEKNMFETWIRNGQTPDRMYATPALHRKFMEYYMSRMK